MNAYWKPNPEDEKQTGVLTLFVEKAYKVPNVGPAYRWVEIFTLRDVTKLQAREVCLDVKETERHKRGVYGVRGEWTPDPVNH